MGQPQDNLNRALQLHQSGQVLEAANLYRKLLRKQPANAQVVYLLGTANLQLGQTELAIEQLKRSVVLDSTNHFAHYNLGRAYQSSGLLTESMASFDRALALKPDYADAHNNRGIILRDLGRHEEALRAFDQAIALRAEYAEAYNNRGNVYWELDRFDEALSSFEHALRVRPDYAVAYVNCSNVLIKLMRLDEAMEYCKKALALNRNYAEAYNKLGVVLSDFRQLSEALANYDQALAIDPDLADAHNNRGNALSDLKRLDEALSSYDRAIKINPCLADAYRNRGTVLFDLNRQIESLTSFDEAYRLKPDLEFHPGSRLNLRMKLCDWNDFSHELACLINGVTEVKPVTPPFEFLGLVDSPELHLKAARIYAGAKFRNRGALGPIAKRNAEGKIRVGYYSADFHNHATAYLMAELFEKHDRSRFELFGFSFGPESNDEMRQRLAAAFDRFIDVRGMGDREVAVLSRELGIDIALDLKGYTRDLRTGIFAERAAPIQVNYLGYPGTMGVNYFDYIIADEIVVPTENRPYFSEQVVYLPHSYQVNDSRRKISDRQFTRRELGLPDEGFVFCCFNNNYKILPTTFDSWARILKAVDKSVLWLFEDNEVAAENLRMEATRRGLDSKRLIFAKRLPLDEHLARHRFANLFIDTLPYNAHTTASDSLWAGLPVLTCTGRSFASRVAASLLNAIGLPELITKNQEEYENTAIRLATDPDKLRTIKIKLERNLPNAPLFNATLFSRHLEAAYEAMYARYQADLPAELIVVRP